MNKFSMAKSAVMGMLSIALSLPTSGVAATNGYDDSRDWGQTVLNYQQYLDYGVPLAETLWVGTHNGYSSKHWKSLYADGWFNHANQQRTPLATFEAGVRWTEYDLHTKSGNADNIVMCHYSGAEMCLSGDYKDFEDGLEEVTEFLVESAGGKYSDSIFFIKVELFGARSQERLAEIMEKAYYSLETGNLTLTSTDPGAGYGYLPDLIYKPEQAKALPGYHWNNDDKCTAIDGAVLKKEDILNAGARIIMMTNNRDCNDGIDELLAPYLFVQSVGYDKNGNFSSYETSMERINTVGNCYGDSDYSGDWHKYNMSYDHDGRTQVSSSASSIADSDVPIYMGCGLNGLEHFNYESNNTSIGSDRKYSYQHIWSWAEYYPDNNTANRCAYLNANSSADTVKDSSGNDVEISMYNGSCSTSHEYLCEKANGDFFITSSTGNWKNGQSACASADATSVFSAPANGADLVEINGIYNPSKGGLWVNFYDTTGNNDWRAKQYLTSFSVENVDENVEKTNQHVDYCGGNAEGNVVLADFSTNNGTDPGVLRMYQSSGECYVVLQEDQSKDSETAQSNERVDVIVLNANFPYGETGVVTTDENSVTVNLSGSYSNPVVIAFAATKDGGDPVVATVENITSNSFDISIQEFEWDDGGHVDEDIHYLVIDEGEYEINGRKFIAGVEDVSTVLDGGLAEHTINVGIDDYKVVTTAQSSDSSYVLDVEVIRSSNSFKVGFMPEEVKDSNGSTITGKIGYIAVEHVGAIGE